MVILEQKYSDLNTYLNPCFNLRKEEKKEIYYGPGLRFCSSSFSLDSVLTVRL